MTSVSDYEHLPYSDPHDKFRESWDEYFMHLACTTRSRATCPRRQVGALVVQNKRIRGTGYNGSLPSHPHCSDVGCDMVAGSCVRTTHAERNALNSIRRRERAGSTLFTTDFPCKDCANCIADSGVVEVVWMIPYWRASEPVNELFEHHGIVSRQYVPFFMREDFKLVL